MAPRRPRKNDEAVESLIRNPSSKTDFRSIGNQQVITNLMFPVWEELFLSVGGMMAAGEVLPMSFQEPSMMVPEPCVSVITRR